VRRVAVLACVTLAACAQLQSSPAPAPEAQLDFSPWVRSCLADNSACFVYTEGKAQSGTAAVTVLLFESERNSKRIVRVTFPLGMSIQPGTRIVVDQDQPISAPYVMCYANGCKADYQASVGLVERLKSGRAVAIQGVNAKGQPIKLVVSLATFASAYNGSPNDASGFNLDADLRNGNQPAFQPRGTLVYSPWTKFCLPRSEPSAKDACFTGKDARVADGTPVGSAVVIEPQGEGQKLLRVTVPLGASIRQGVQIKYDQSKSVTAVYVVCFNAGCMADYPATNETINRLKAGKSLLLEYVQSTGQRNSVAFPLSDFANAFDGPPVDPKALEAQRKNLQAQ
jgi:invasion protein IalB